jgi:zinc and cadmium transporter
MPQTINTFLIIFSITLGVSLIGLVGGMLLLWREASIQRWSRYLLSFAAGTILGATFFDLLPEALEYGDPGHSTIAFAILGGILLFFILEKLSILHHHAHDHDIDHAAHATHYSSLATARPLIIFGDALHNFLDGVIIAIAFLTSVPLGIITAIAVVAHEIPQEIGDFSILIHSGMDRRKVLLWNLYGALVSPLGVVVAFLAAGWFASVQGIVLAFVVGTFAYIALADLIPTIKHERSLSRSLGQIATIIAGAVVIWGVGQVLPHG